MRAMEFLWLTLSQLFIAAFILRFLLQLARADFYNPVSQLVVRITQPLLRPVRRLVPAWGPVDIATILIVLVDRKSTRLNSSHVATSYAVFRLQKLVQENVM